LQRSSNTTCEEGVVVFDGYSFRYKSQKYPTLKNIDLSVRRGEKILIIGPSGSGKSTIGSCLNGLIPDSYEGEREGSLRVAGSDPAEAGVSDMGKMVGTVLQDTDGQFVGLSVAEDIAFALENECTPQPEMKRIVEKTSKMVGMEEFLSHSPHAMSGGQKQRVSLAGILVDEVDLLLFDEPLANLDPKTGKLAVELIDSIHSETGKTVVIVEHRLEDVLHRSVDRVIMIDKGEILVDMDADSLLASDLLYRKGIREPLYITALKLAGCEVRAQDRIAHIHSIDLEPYREKVRKWFISRPRPGTVERGESLLRIEELSYSYDGIRNALERISIDLSEGEMVSVLGKNGAGKSTLSSIVMGILKPDMGKIQFRGEDITNDNISSRSRRIGYVMQNPNHMISEFNVYDEVAFGPRKAGLSEADTEERVAKVLRLCDLYTMRKWPINVLSYGQKKRVTVASILVMEPQLLILDEPTAGQDYYHYTEIMEFIRRLNKELKITILIVTHDLHLALEYTDRSIVLSDGRLLSDDKVERIFSNEDVIEEANLKLTSLYELAHMVGIEETDEFIRLFIDEEKASREWTIEK